MARTFSMHTMVEPCSLLARTKRVAKENGVTLAGGKHSGRFSHDIVGGEYRMVGQTVIVTVTEKHLLIPWPVVESWMKALVQ